MAAKDSSELTPSDGAPSRRELAVARSLDPARVKAEKRVQKFLDAATELMESSSGKEFTLQEVIERSGQSLRSFYQYFAGKHELLLALFEDSVRSTAEHLQTLVETETEPMDRLHRFVVEHYKICRPSRRKGAKTLPSPAMAEFAQQLLTEHPKEASRAFVPMVELLDGLLEDAIDAGAIRGDLDRGHITGILLQAVMFNAFATTISGVAIGDDADAASAEFWDFIIAGLEAPPRGRKK